MKGLLIKDFSLLKNQKNFFILVFVMAGFLTIANGAESSPATFVLPYVGFVSSFFVLSTISYDEYDNGNAFLFTLPFERKVYVVEKYVFRDPYRCGRDADHSGLCPCIYEHECQVC